MSTYQLIKTRPGETHFDLFVNLPAELYPAESARFRLGFDPVARHLEGCYVLLLNGQAVGRFAFYENLDLRYQDQATACIGSYECTYDQKASEYLLSGARALAIQKGYCWLIGPMEGTTWNSYRFGLQNQQPHFFMEPCHHDYYTKQFSGMGFKTIANYLSNIDQTLICDALKLKRWEKYYLDKGAIFRKLNPDNMESDLRKIAVLSNEAFADNFLYTPICIDDFVAKYAKLRSYFDPQFIWLVEDAQGTLQAFLFTIKDHWNTHQKTLIIKSMVRKKKSPFRGVCSYLSGMAVQTAKDLNYQSIIHAFMIQDNTSVRISEKYQGSAYKTYALYGLDLNKPKLQ